MNMSKIKNLTQFCDNANVPTSINDPDYREKVSKLVPCGDFPSETECTQILG